MPSQSPRRDSRDREGKRPSRSNSSSHSSPSRKSAKRPRSYSNERSRPPPARREAAPNTKLFVTNIDSKFTEAELQPDLRQTFEPFGTIKEIVIKTKQGSTNSYCFIEYEQLESAIKAQSELNRIEFKGKELKVEFGKGERKTEDRKSDKCYICHKEGHFAKDCRYNRYKDRHSDDHHRDRDDRDRRYRYDDRDYDRDRHSRDRRDYRDHDRKRKRHDSYSSQSSSSRSVRRRRGHSRDKYDRDHERRGRDYDRRDRDHDYRRRDSHHRSPERRERRQYYQKSRRYD